MPASLRIVMGVHLSGETVKDFFIVGIDIAGYSRKDLPAQMASQLAIDRALSEALRGDRFKEKLLPKWLDGGDGGYALFEWASGRDVFELMQQFFIILNRDNREKKDDHLVSVRAAMHQGQVLCWSGADNTARYTSHAINECARFLAGMARDPGRVVCSKIFMEKIAGIDPIATSTRLKDVIDKHELAHEVYNLERTPGFGKPPSEQNLHPNPFC
jgi:hypothetical protein